MSGFYVHIPFCRKVCYYCDFHFVASLNNYESLIQNLKKEIANRKNKWSNNKFESIYFGGGTPSVLPVNQLSTLFSSIYKNYNIEKDIEITLEANPDDLTSEYLKELRQNTPVNRLSIGIQSFNEKDLVFFNRRHSASQALKCLENAKNTGFENITIDLLYGYPGMSEDTLINNLKLFIKLDIPHLSAYHLSIEPKTVFGVWQKKKKFKGISEENSTKQYKILTDFMKNAGFTHYEISSFTKNNMFSKHNKSYWNSTPYIGIGPSAHSYDGNSRRWNIANNSIYADCLSKGNNNYYDIEQLTITDKYNDYIITSLRTIWGINLDYLKQKFPARYIKHFFKVKSKLEKTNNLEKTLTGYKITEEGWLISDYIMSEFIYDGE